MKNIAGKQCIFTILTVKTKEYWKRNYFWRIYFYFKTPEIFSNWASKYTYLSKRNKLVKIKYFRDWYVFYRFRT